MLLAKHTYLLMSASRNKIGTSNVRYRNQHLAVSSMLLLHALASVVACNIIDPIIDANDCKSQGNTWHMLLPSRSPCRLGIAAHVVSPLLQVLNCTNSHHVLLANPGDPRQEGTRIDYDRKSHHGGCLVNEFIGITGVL
jgi:hypothetical protein